MIENSTEDLAKAKTTRFNVEFQDLVYHIPGSCYHRHIFRVFKDGIPEDILRKVDELQVMTDKEDYFEINWIEWLYFLRKHSLLETVDIEGFTNQKGLF
jgi:hypothetical protein